jgi:hypothetical protein
LEKGRRAGCHDRHTNSEGRGSLPWRDSFSDTPCMAINRILAMAGVVGSEVRQVAAWWPYGLIGNRERLISE